MTSCISSHLVSPLQTPKLVMSRCIAAGTNSFLLRCIPSAESPPSPLSWKTAGGFSGKRWEKGYVEAVCKKEKGAMNDLFTGEELFSSRPFPTNCCCKVKIYAPQVPRHPPGCSLVVVLSVLIRHGK